MPFIPQWIRSIRLSRSANQPKRTKQRIPVVELLEDRLSPAALTVTSLADNDSKGTLRYEIGQANAGDTIEFKAGLSGTIILNPTLGPLVISTPDIAIIGPTSAPGIEISGNNQIQDLEISNTSGAVGLAYLTFTGGYAGSGASGGGIYEADDTASSLDMYYCTIAGNHATGGGGGIAMGDGNVGLYDCTIYGNSSGSAGGGGIMAGSPTNTLGNLTIVNCTIAGNTTSGPGGGIVFVGNAGVTVTMYNTIVANNVEAAGTVSGAAGDVDDELQDSNPTVSNDLIGNAAAWPGVQNGKDCILGGINGNPVVNPLLTPLQNNGGPTQTLALIPGSPALDAGSAALALEPNGQPLQVDQRGPGFPRTIKGTCDIGAVEEGPNAVYVGSLYSLLLHRAADIGSLTWVNMLDAGASPTSIVLDIEASNEYLTDRVIGLYHQFFNRNPDPAGLQYWVSQLAAGVPITTVEADFCASPEYFLDHSDNDLNFVYGLYQDILNRQASVQEAQYWAKQLLYDGLSRYQCALDFLFSNEYLTDYVTTVYEQFLRRPPSASDLAYWVPQLEAGLSDQQFTADVIGSPEAYNLYS